MTHSQISTHPSPVAGSGFPVRSSPAHIPGIATPPHRAVAHPPWKRALDISCICLALPVVMLVVVFVVMYIRIVSPGPVIFRQERIGHRGRPFLCWKFRSMIVNADEDEHRRDILHRIHADLPMCKMDGLGDARLIPGGAILRATGLDELPQLLNVWRGEMSLVGPRPCTTYEFQSYQAHHLARFETLPGLTGLWQVSGKNRTTFNEMIELDVHYARTKTLTTDLTIMSRTFGTVVDQLMNTMRPRRAGTKVQATRSA